MSQGGSVAPRARIDLTYRPSCGDHAPRVELPLKILVLGDFTRRPDDRPLDERRPVAVDRERLDRALAELNLVLDVVVAGAGSDAGRSVRLALDGLAAFTPEGVLRQAPDLLPAQLQEALRDERFQELERAWRSLAYLVDHVDQRENIAVEVLHCTKDDLALDFEDAPDVPRSGLYKTVYGSAFHTFGGQPYGLIVGDYAFDAGPEDLALLEKLASVAAMAHAPFVAAAAPSMFGLGSWGELPALDDLSTLFEAPRYEAWRRFRDGSNARYVALTLPRFLLRLPHALPAGALARAEDGAADPARCLWGNVAFALAARVADAFARYRLCANIIGPRGGGAVEDLPLPRREGVGAQRTMAPTECVLSLRREYALSEAGFIALTFCEGSEPPCFFSANSVQRARYFGQSPEGRAAETRDRLGGQLPYLLLLSRFAHYFKVMTRHRVGVWMERRDIEFGLKEWLRQHTADMDDPAPGPLGPRLLRRAVVEVSDVEGQACWYRFHLRVCPQFTYMGAAFELSLVGKIDKD